jgi:polar amino acid transport system permease protein
MGRPFTLSEFFYLVEALRWTIVLSLAAVVVGGILGGIIALLRTAPLAPLRWLTAAYIEVFQGTPLLLQVFIAYFGLGLFGFALDPFVAATLALSLHTGAFLGEIWRGCIEAVPKGQWEAGKALSLSYWQQLRTIIVPQAIPLSVPPSVGFLVQLIKGTSVVSLVGFAELTRAGALVSNVTFDPLLVYGVVALLYLALCWPLASASKRLERRLKAPTQRVAEGLAQHG